MLYTHDKFFLIFKKALMTKATWVDVKNDNIVVSLIAFLQMKGYILNVVNINQNTIRLFLNPVHSVNRLTSLHGNFSKRRSNTLSLVELRALTLKNKHGLFLSSDGIVDLSRSFFYTKRGSVRPLFLSR